MGGVRGGWSWKADEHAHRGHRIGACPYGSPACDSPGTGFTGVARCYQGNSATSPGMRIVKQRATWYITNGIMTECSSLLLTMVLCMHIIDAGGEAGPPTAGARCQARRGRQE